jgi:hypothetical protein
MEGFWDPVVEKRDREDGQVAVEVEAEIDEGGYEG